MAVNRDWGVAVCSLPTSLDSAPASSVCCLIGGGGDAPPHPPPPVAAAPVLYFITRATTTRPSARRAPATESCKRVTDDLHADLESTRRLSRAPGAPGGPAGREGGGAPRPRGVCSTARGFCTVLSHSRHHSARKKKLKSATRTAIGVFPHSGFRIYHIYFFSSEDCKLTR